MIRRDFLKSCLSAISGIVLTPAAIDTLAASIAGTSPQLQTRVTGPAIVWMVDAWCDSIPDQPDIPVRLSLQTDGHTVLSWVMSRRASWRWIADPCGSLLIPEGQVLTVEHDAPPDVPLFASVYDQHKVHLPGGKTLSLRRFAKE